jgi:hypothetical protein
MRAEANVIIDATMKVAGTLKEAMGSTRNAPVSRPTSFRVVYVENMPASTSLLRLSCMKVVRATPNMAMKNQRVRARVQARAAL